MTIRQLLTISGLVALVGLLTACTIGGDRVIYPGGIWFEALPNRPFREVGWARVHRLDPCPLAAVLPTGRLGSNELSDRAALKKRGWEESGCVSGQTSLRLRINALTVTCEYDAAGGCTRVTIRVLDDQPPAEVAEVGDIRVTLPASRDELPTALGERPGGRR